MGLEKGDRVFIFAKTRMEWMATAMACWRAGATVAALTTTCTDESVQFTLKQVSPKIVVTEDEYLGKLDEMRARLSLEFKLMNLDNSSLQGKTMTFSSLLENGKHPSQPLSQPNQDDEALLMYTSGTGGKPKGVMFTHAQVNMANYGILVSRGVNEKPCNSSFIAINVQSKKSRNL